MILGQHVIAYFPRMLTNELSEYCVQMVTISYWNGFVFWSHCRSPVRRTRLQCLYGVTEPNQCLYTAAALPSNDNSRVTACHCDTESRAGSETGHTYVNNLRAGYDGMLQCNAVGPSAACTGWQLTTDFMTSPEWQICRAVAVSNAGTGEWGQFRRSILTVHNKKRLMGNVSSCPCTWLK
jgi:hypothetical protein